MNFINILESKSYCEEARDLFTDTFYEEIGLGVFDAESPSPWGCPWYDDRCKLLRGESIEEAAKLYARDSVDEILEALEREKEVKKEQEED